MKILVTVVFAALFVCSTATCAEKNISQLIDDLAVKDKGNHTCNTACGILLMKKDEAVPALRDALRNQNTKIRYYAVRCLGDINTKAARSALIDAYANGVDDVRNHAAYALTWHPEQDAEDVYFEFLNKERDKRNERDEWSILYTIKALGEIRSKNAVPSLTRIRDHPTGWHSHYTALVALRKINEQELPPETQGALKFLRQAKYSSDIDMQKLAASVKIIKKDLRTVMPDIFDIVIWTTKGNETTIAPNAKTILHEAGPLALATVRIGLDDPDDNVSSKAKKFIEEFGKEERMKENLQPDGAANRSQPIRSN